MHVPYRTLLANNVRALMDRVGLTPETLKAVYLDGTKRGQVVGVRSIRNLTDPEGPSVGIDILAAVAFRLRCQVYHLLVPGLDPVTHPPGQEEDWIEAEVERRVVARLRIASKTRQGLVNDSGMAVSSGSNRTDSTGRRSPDVASPFRDSPVSVDSTPASTAAPKAKKRGRTKKLARSE